MSEYLDYLTEVEDARDKINDLALKMYQQGRADQKEEDNEFFNFDGAWELARQKSELDGARKFAEWLTKKYGFDHEDIENDFNEWQKETEVENE